MDTRATVAEPFDDSRRPAPPDPRHRRRVLGQPGRVVRLLRLFLHLALFRRGLLPLRRPHQPAAGRGRGLRRGLPGAADRRLGLRPAGGPPRPAVLHDGLGPADVLRQPDDRGAADPGQHRRAGAGPADRGAAGPGAVGRRRIRHQRHLHERGRGRRAARLLCQLPVRHADRRPAAGGAGDRAAGGAADRRADARLGLAHPLRHRRRGRRRGAVPPPRLARDAERREGRAGGGRLAACPGAGPPEAPAAGARPDRRGQPVLLRLHHLHAEIPGQHRRPADADGQRHHGRGAVLLHAAAAGLRRAVGPARAAGDAADLRRARGR